MMNIRLHHAIHNREGFRMGKNNKYFHGFYFVD
ncbi:Uncharacterised protein [Klebsiella pneumoniae]|nr:Uncharacterised protein [Klebsiella pneumoniae]